MPLPPLKFPLGCEPQASTTRGRGERPVGAAGEGERPDAKQNAQLCPTPRQALRPSAKQAAGGAPRPRRKGAKATRQPVARTHERARPAAKPTRPTTERRPAGAGAATPPPHAPARARPRQRTAARRRGGRRRRRPGGIRAREPAAPPLPSAQSAPLNRRSSAADADGSDEHGAQTGGTAAGRGTLPPSAQSSARPSGRATGQATGRKADGRDGAAGAILAACSPLWRFFSAVGDISCPSHLRTPQNGEKSLDLGLVLCALIVLYLFGGV